MLGTRGAVQRLSDNEPAPAVMAWVREHVRKRDHVLDVGCGDKRYEDLRCRRMVSVDAWRKAQPDVLLDLEKESLPFEPVSFDVVLLLDVLEHLSHESAVRVLEQAEAIARRWILALTPLPEFWTENREPVENPRCWWYGCPWGVHRSVVAPWEFGRGWERVRLPGFAEYYIGRRCLL